MKSKKAVYKPQKRKECHLQNLILDFQCINHYWILDSDDLMSKNGYKFHLQLSLPKSTIPLNILPKKKTINIDAK